MTYTKETLAALLNGREYGSEISPPEERDAQASGLIVIFGASDDLTEFSGAIHDEAGACHNRIHKLHARGLLADHEERCDCAFCGYEAAAAKKCATVQALWCAEKDYSWTFKTELPHATFEIVEDGQPYCRGLVIDAKDLPA